jgi:demethylmenaquinone methyltransferase/2-methoxy-6-polyprenyl-1,4-benzoquinol methylase
MVDTKSPTYRIFTSIPSHYDIINHVITLGLDSSWRLAAIRHCLSPKPARFLDLCCGTADLAIGVSRRAGYDIDVFALDYSLPMLELALHKAKTLVNKPIIFVHGDAANLPFPNDCFDCVGMSFAFRSMSYRNPAVPRYLAEVLRVLRKGGKYIILETSQPGVSLVRGAYHLYMGCIASPVGAFISGDGEAYRFLAESARSFYTPHELEELLLGAGFSGVFHQPLAFGATSIHVASK